MKCVYIAFLGLLFLAVDTSPSTAQGACPGPNCRSASAAAAGQAAAKAADEKKKAQRDAAKAAEAVKSTAPNMSTPGQRNMSQPSTMDTVNSVKLGDQNSTPNRRPEIEDIKNAKSPQQKRALYEGMKKWDKDHPPPAQPTDSESSVVRAINNQLRSTVSPDYKQPCKGKDCPPPPKNGGPGIRG